MNSKTPSQSSVDFDDTSELSSPLTNDDTLSMINNDSVTSTPDTVPDESSEEESDHKEIMPTEPKLLEDGRFDILTTHPGKVIKRIIKEGRGPTPGYEFECKVLYRGKLPDGTVFDEQLEKSHSFQFTIGHHSVIKGWEVAVWSMKKHEKAEFYIAPEYAYGTQGSPPKIPPNTPLIFEIELLSFFKEPITHSEKIQYSLQLKEKGQRYVSKGKWELALKTYRDAQSDINDLYHRKLYLREQLLPIKIALHLNVALCSLKVDPPQYKRVLHETTWVLLLSSNNVKALYRRGVAQQKLGDYSDSVESLTKAFKLNPNDNIIINELNRSRYLLKQKEEKERRMFSGIFQRMQEQDHHEHEIAKKKQQKSEKTLEEKQQKKEERRIKKENKRKLKEKLKNMHLDEIQTNSLKNEEQKGSIKSGEKEGKEENEERTQTRITGFSPIPFNSPTSLQQKKEEEERKRREREEYSDESYTSSGSSDFFLGDGKLTEYETTSSSSLPLPRK